MHIRGLRVFRQLATIRPITVAKPTYRELSSHGSLGTIAWIKSSSSFADLGAHGGAFETSGEYQRLCEPILSVCRVTCLTPTLPGPKRKCPALLQGGRGWE